MMNNSNVNAATIFAFAKTLARTGHNELRTLHRPKRFRVEVGEDHLIYTPLESPTQSPRWHDRETLEWICIRYEELRVNDNKNCLRPGRYDGTNTRNASYTLTLIKLFVESQEGQK
jgi:hypothetical protein